MNHQPWNLTDGKDPEKNSFSLTLVYIRNSVIRVKSISLQSHGYNRVAGVSLPFIKPDSPS